VTAVRERFLQHPARAFWLGAVLLGLVTLMAIVIPADPLAIDERWSDAMNAIETAFLTDLALVFNWLGRGVGWILSLTIVGVVLLLARRWLALACFAAIETASSLGSGLMKAAVGRPRPPHELIHPVGSSFPSGHAAYAGATCVALVLLFTSPGPRRRWWWTLAAAGILGMAWSRTYLEVHWLTDVVGGSLLGVGISLVVLGGAQWWQDGPRIGSWRTSNSS
jgi:membrane-associated phospholipid phosphatase